jgi:hypothetical protein
MLLFLCVVHLCLWTVCVCAARLRLDLSHVPVRCRIVLGTPKAGTTWLMHILWTYLLMAVNHSADEQLETFQWAFGHMKRVEATCQYATGDKRREFRAQELAHAYELLPGFSHVTYNYNVSRNADGPIDEELADFERFFGLRMDIERVYPPGATKTVHPGQRFFGSLPSVHHFDRICAVAFITRAPLPQSVSACFYYDGICGGGAGEAALERVLDLPSSHPQSIAVPLNATLRWRRALASVLRNAVIDESHDSADELSSCPAIPHSKKGDGGSAHRSLHLRGTMAMTYEDLVENVARETRRLLAFFELPVDDDLLKAAIDDVASRPERELKQGITAHHVLDMFTPAQLAFVAEIAGKLDVHR